MQLPSLQILSISQTGPTPEAGRGEPCTPWHGAFPSNHRKEEAHLLQALGIHFPDGHFRAEFSDFEKRGQGVGPGDTAHNSVAQGNLKCLRKPVTPNIQVVTKVPGWFVALQPLILRQ